MNTGMALRVDPRPDPVFRRHRGIDVTNYFNEDEASGYPNGCVHNVTAHDFMLSGIEVDHAMTVPGGSVAVVREM